LNICPQGLLAESIALEWQTSKAMLAHWAEAVLDWEVLELA
jgi:hypothetical protein